MRFCPTSSYLVVVVYVVPRETNIRVALLWTSILSVQIVLIQTRKKNAGCTGYTGCTVAWVYWVFDWLDLKMLESIVSVLLSYWFKLSG